MGIKVEEIEDGAGRRLLEPFTFYDGVRANIGWEWDGNSVPTVFFFIVQPFMDLELSCRHDLDCAECRDIIKMADESVFQSERKALIKEAESLRKIADKRYRDGTIKRRKKRNSKKKFNNITSNIVGWAAYGGVRIGSFFNIGW